MNRFDNFTKPLMWFMALLLAAFVAGCGSNSSSSPAQSSTKALTAFSFNGYTAYPGLITAPSGLTPGRVAVILPNGTNVTTLVAKFATTGQTVTVAGTTQGSGVTPNDFTTPVSYKVTAGDGTQATYDVTVSIAPANAKALTAFSLAASGVPGTATGTITEPAHTVAVTLPYGTPLTSLIATFTTTGASVTVAGALQESGTTPNTFPASPVSLAYTVHAADTTTAVYNVTVTVSLNPAKAITSFSLVGASGVITAASGVTPATIAVTLPSGTTDLTALVATFVTTGASVTVAGSVQNPQQSGITPNDFSAASGVAPTPVPYTVHAADTTTAVYNVTVTVAAAANPGPAGPSPDLKTAGTYGVFSGANAAVTLVDNSTSTGSLITGNVGLMNGGGVCTACDAKSVSGVIENGTAAAIQAQIDFNAAYTDAAGRSANRCTLAAFTEIAGPQGACAAVTPNPPGSNTTFGSVTAPTYGPGLYTSGSTIILGVNKTIFLDAGGNADAVFIFQAGSAITTNNGSKVILINGALAKNVWWMALADATLGNSSTFSGTVIAKGAIGIVVTAGSTSGAPMVVDGRLFSSAAAVTLPAFTTVNVPAP